LNNKTSFREVEQGVFELIWGKRLIKVIVSSRVALETRNALWLLFSGKPQRFAYGDEHYQWRHPRERAVLNQLYELYKKEGVVMPYTMDDFNRDFTRDHLHLLRPEELLKDLPTEERLKGLPPEERLKGLSPEIIETYLSQLRKSN
jgi:hypothetical protein